MTPSDDAMEQLAALGIRLGYRLTVAAPKGAVDDNIRHLLARNKAAFVASLALDDLRANPPADAANFPSLDADGFDWRQGEQTELARLDAAMAVRGFERVDADAFDRRCVAFDPPKFDAPGETEVTTRPKRNSPAKGTGTPLFPTDGEPKESEVP